MIPVCSNLYSFIRLCYSLTGSMKTMVFTSQDQVDSMQEPQLNTKMHVEHQDKLRDRTPQL